MEWIAVVTLIVVGLALIIVEIIIIPGTTFVGFVGFGFCIAGVFLSFHEFGNTVGWITLGSSGVVTFMLFYWALRTKTWENFH